MQKITNFLFWVLWAYRANSIKNNNANLKKHWCLSTCKKMNSITNFFFWDFANLFFEYFENAWSCPSMIVSPCRKIWYPKCWNQLVGNFFYLHAKKSTSYLTSFFRYWRYCKLAILGTLGMLEHPYQKLHYRRKLSYLSASKISI